MPQRPALANEIARAAQAENGRRTALVTAEHNEFFFVGRAQRKKQPRFLRHFTHELQSHAVLVGPKIMVVDHRPGFGFSANRSRDPARLLRRCGPLSGGVVFPIYMPADNIADAEYARIAALPQFVAYEPAVQL